MTPSLEVLLWVAVVLRELSPLSRYPPAMWKCRHINNSVIRRRCFAGNNKTVLAINDANLQHTIEATKYNRAILHPQCNFSGSYLRHSRIKCVKFCFNTGMITCRKSCQRDFTISHCPEKAPNTGPLQVFSFRHYNVSRNPVLLKL